MAAGPSQHTALNVLPSAGQINYSENAGTLLWILAFISVSQVLGAPPLREVDREGKISEKLYPNTSLP